YGSSEAAIRMREGLAAGALVIAPSRAVKLGGKEQLAWWRVDPASGETVDVAEDGLHQDQVEYLIVVNDPKRLYAARSITTYVLENGIPVQNHYTLWFDTWSHVQHILSKAIVSGL